MNRETNFMNFENLNRLIEEHKKETHPYKKYEFDSTSYTLLLIDINNLVKENKVLKENAENNDKVVDKTNWENQLLKKENKKLNGAIQTYDILLKSNVEENKKLKDNWNKLKEGLRFCYEYDYGVLSKDYLECVDDTLDKIKELEESDNNEKENKIFIKWL